MRYTGFVKLLFGGGTKAFRRGWLSAVYDRETSESNAPAEAEEDEDEQEVKR